MNNNFKKSSLKAKDAHLFQLRKCTLTTFLKNRNVRLPMNYSHLAS